MKEVVEYRPDGTSFKTMKECTWTINNAHGTEIQHVKPLLDRTHTPRGRRSKIELARNFEKEKHWNPANIHLRELRIPEK